MVFPDRELSGTYQETESNRTGKLYQIHLADWGQGYGVCSYTEHATGQRLPTLAVTFPEKATFTFTGQAKTT